MQITAEKFRYQLTKPVTTCDIAQRVLRKPATIRHEHYVCHLYNHFFTGFRLYCASLVKIHFEVLIFFSPVNSTFS